MGIDPVALFDLGCHAPWGVLGGVNLELDDASVFGHLQKPGNRRSRDLQFVADGVHGQILQVVKLRGLEGQANPGFLIDLVQHNESIAHMCKLAEIYVRGPKGSIDCWYSGIFKEESGRVYEPEHSRIFSTKRA